MLRNPFFRRKFFFACLTLRTKAAKKNFLRKNSDGSLFWNLSTLFLEVGS